MYTKIHNVSYISFLSQLLKKIFHINLRNSTSSASVTFKIRQISLGNSLKKNFYFENKVRK